MRSYTWITRATSGSCYTRDDGDARVRRECTVTAATRSLCTVAMATAKHGYPLVIIKLYIMTCYVEQHYG